MIKDGMQDAFVRELDSQNSSIYIWCA